MTSSLQIAEDCLKSTSDGDQAQDMGTPFEGVQKFAQTIDSGKYDWSPFSLIAKTQYVLFKRLYSSYFLKAQLCMAVKQYSWKYKVLMF